MNMSQFDDEEDNEVNLTPMLDVVFILLIFFIVTGSFVAEAGIDVNRPNAATAERKEKGNILVAISQSDLDRQAPGRPACAAGEHRAHARRKSARVCSDRGRRGEQA